MICPNCGTTIPDGRDSCLSCGSRIEMPSYADFSELNSKQKNEPSSISNSSFSNTRKGVITFQVIAVLVYIGLIIFYVKAYNDADNWISADSYKIAGISAGVLLGLTIISIITASFNLMKVTIGICILTVLLSILNLMPLIAAVFLIIAIIFAFRANKRKKQLRMSAT